MALCTPAGVRPPRLRYLSCWLATPQLTALPRPSCFCKVNGGEAPPPPPSLSTGDVPRVCPAGRAKALPASFVFSKSRCSVSGSPLLFPPCARCSFISPSSGLGFGLLFLQLVKVESRVTDLKPSVAFTGGACGYACPSEHGFSCILRAARCFVLVRPKALSDFPCGSCLDSQVLRSMLVNFHLLENLPISSVAEFWLPFPVADHPPCDFDPFKGVLSCGLPRPELARVPCVLGEVHTLPSGGVACWCLLADYWGKNPYP